MATIFKPREESPEGWRTTPLGWLACLFGWHFGQILLNEPWEEVYRLKCARCKRIYKRRRED